MDPNFPVRCFTCGKVIAHLEDEYKKKVQGGREPAVVMDELKLKRFCCRRMFVSACDIGNLINGYPVHKDRIHRLYDGKKDQSESLSSSEEGEASDEEDGDGEVDEEEEWSESEDIEEPNSEEGEASDASDEVSDEESDESE